MEKIIVSLQPQSGVSYPIYVDDDVLLGDTLFDECLAVKDKSSGNRVVVIVEGRLKELYGEPVKSYFLERGVVAELLAFVGGERNKTRKKKEKIEDALMALGCGRDTCLVAVGGGVTSDLVGFVAATYCRGVSAVYLPTSLLAMVDASVGGKTAVNTPCGKNLIGAFYQPKAVFVGLSALKTLPLPEYKNGLVEAIKYAVICDEGLLCFIEDNAGSIKDKDLAVLQELISRVCKIKKEIVECDERDIGRRQICNFGHTVGHAIEQVAQYRIKHGRAVAIGMEAANYIACKMGILSETDALRVRSLWKKFAIAVSLSVRMPLSTPYDVQKIMAAMKLDKKALAGTVRFVLLDGIGRWYREESGGACTTPVPDYLVEEGIVSLIL